MAARANQIGMRLPRLVLPLTAAAVAVATAAAYATGAGVPVSPATHETGNGRVLSPAGRLTEVGNFPTGGVLTPDGRFYWAVSTGRGLNDIRIVDVRRDRVVQVLPIPGASGGITLDPRRHLAYVSGVADSSHTDQARPGLPGRAGDDVQVFRYDPRSGRARFDHLIAVPPPQGSPIPQGIASIPGYAGPPQNFPPTNTQRLSWPDRLTLSADGTTLLVPLNLADQAAVVDTATRSVHYVATGSYPYGAAVDDGTGYVSNEGAGTVSVLNLATATKSSDITVGATLSHPEAMTVDPDRHLLYVTLANADELVVVDTLTNTVVGRTSLRWPRGLGASPVALALDREHHRLYVAEEGVDALAVLDTTPVSPRLAGLVPTAAFPDDVAVSTAGCHSEHGACGALVWLSGKGFGTGPNLNGPVPTSPLDNDNQIDSFQYLPSWIRGMVGALALPTDGQLPHLTDTALRQVAPANEQAAPPRTPVRADGPIKHVFFIVKENRTYDQVLGDDPRGDGDPNLVLFGRSVTPNTHALADRFGVLDHVFADSEASIDGHFWTSAASVSDYVQKNWMQNYGGRGRPYDFGVYAITWPGNGFLFDQAQRQGISYFNYGEAIAGDVPVPDKNRDAAATQEVLTKFAHSDLGLGTKTGVAGLPAGECYPNDADIATDSITQAPTYDASPPAGAPANAESRADCFAARFAGQLAAGTVPAFNYLVLPNDHTVGTTPGARTPQAMVADNDYGLGQIVQTISSSSIWSSSAIFVVEDDSQDGADHVDAHRVPALVISPYTRPGQVVHTRYDFLSMIHTMELILGMHPMGLADALATPMYDVFSSQPDNAAAYTTIEPAQSRSALNTAASPDAALSASLDFRTLDQVPQRELDVILWHAVHGAASPPPPPGPNSQDASTGDG